MKDSQLPEIDIVKMSQLIDAAREGDSKAKQLAQNEICRQVQGQLNQMANNQLDVNLRLKVNPSDIVQATLTRMVQGFADFRGTSSNEFYGWLNTILKHEVSATRRNFQRQRRDFRREIQPNSNNDLNHLETVQDRPEKKIQSQENLIRFQQVIDRLPPDYVQVIQLKGIQELSVDDVAKQMDRSLNAVSKLWSRALIALHKELSKLDDSISI